MKISIIGTGYVGLVTGVSLALQGHNVVCIGRNKKKIARINEGKSPFYEPMINRLLKKVVNKSFLLATDIFEKNIITSDITIVAVGTPTVNNKIDLTDIKKISVQIGKTLKKSKKYHVVVIKSTVIPTTTENIVLPILKKYSGKNVPAFGLCMNPEFLREGNAIEDALNPDRIVIGQYDKKSGKKLAEVYKNLSCPKIFTTLTTAEMIKYTANSLFATLISYSNEIARICQTIGNIDVVDVWGGVHLDNRLSPIINKKRITPGFIHYLSSGCGYGGSCFPKDTKALYAYAESIGINGQILKSVIQTNKTQPLQMISLLKRAMKTVSGKKITILGLSFKPQTDDIRESAAIPIIESLIKQKANITVHDPIARLIDPKLLEKVKIASDIKEALYNADAVLVLTAWDQYKKLIPKDFLSSMKNAIVVDGRRIYDKEYFISCGVIYEGIGLG